MTKMTTLIATAALMAGLSTTLTAALAAPADARPRTPIANAMASHWDGGNARASARIDSRIGDLKTQISVAKRAHRLSLKEASRLTIRLDGIRSDKRADERHGLSDREVAALNASLDRLSTDIRIQSNDHNRR